MTMLVNALPSTFWHSVIMVIIKVAQCGFVFVPSIISRFTMSFICFGGPVDLCMFSEGVHPLIGVAELC